MHVHANAKLGPAGRSELVRKVLEGEPLRSVAAQTAVSVATAHRWWHRWLAASAAERESGVWLEERSSRPRRSPRQLTAETRRKVDGICAHGAKLIQVRFVPHALCHYFGL